MWSTIEVEISCFRECDTDTVFEIQQAAYKPLYEKYHDDSSNPYMESKEAVYHKYTRAGTTGYLFILNGAAVGAVRINTYDDKSGRVLNSTPIVRQYDILDNKWGVVLCQKENQTKGTQESSSKK